MKAIHLSTTQFLGVLAAGAACTLGASSAYGDNISWVGGSGNFGDATRWNPAVVPNDDDNAIFNTGQNTAYTVTLDADRAVNSFNIQNDTLILDVGSFDLEFGVDDFNVGLAGQHANLTLTSSATSDQGSVIGGAGEELSIGFGNNADGSLIITDGATFTRGGSGDITIGSGSGAKGSLTVRDGGVAVLKGSQFIAGNGAFDHSQISVLDGGSLTTGGNVYLARTGEGAVDILIDNATWLHEHTSQGVYFGSSAVGQGSATINITIRNGGTASTTVGTGYRIFDHERAGAMAKRINVLVTGSISSMRSGYHYIGGGNASAIESDHDVTIAGGATLGVQTILKIWEAADTNGDGAFGEAGVLTLDTGIVEVKGGSASDAAGQVVVRGKLRGNGTIQRESGTGDGRFTLTVEGGGELRPGDLSDSTPGIGAIAVIDGDVVFVDGTLVIDLDASTGDQLQITGDLDLSSTLDTLHVQGLGGAASYVIATYTGTLTGTFDNVALPEGYSIGYGTGSDSAITLMIPEPTALGLFGIGLIGAVHRPRRR